MRLALLLLVLPLFAQSDSRLATWTWRGSVAVLAAGETADAASSWRQPEANRFWGAPRFGTRGLAQTIAINGAVVLFEHRALRVAGRSRWRWPVLAVFIAANVYSGARGARQARRNWATTRAATMR